MHHLHHLQNDNNPLKHRVLMGYYFAPLAPFCTTFQHCNFAMSMAMNTDIAMTIRQTRCAIGGRMGRADNIKFNNNMNTNLIELAKQCPGLQVTVTLGELVEANNLLIAETKRELEQIITDQNTETYPSREKVMEMLDVSQSTMWRWQKSGYLVPLNVGGKRRYRMSDVRRILEGDNVQKGDVS